MGPVALGWVAVATAAAGAGVAAYGSAQQGAALKQQQGYQAAVALQNKQLSENAAAVARKTGEAQEQAKREQTAQVISQQKAIGAASGSDVSSGSASRVIGDSAQLGELDALTIRNNAARAAFGYQSQGIAYGATAAMDLAAGKNASEAGQLGAFASIIGGASSVSSKWMSFQQSGVPTFSS